MSGFRQVILATSQYVDVLADSQTSPVQQPPSPTGHGYEDTFGYFQHLPVGSLAAFIDIIEAPDIMEQKQTIPYVSHF